MDIRASLTGIAARAASGATLTAPKVDSVNTFEAPETVRPRPVSPRLERDTLTLRLEPKSVTVISVE